MDKVTRMLILYANLAKGERVNKTIFCFQNDCSIRTFERDIDDIRLYLSESFSGTELCYDRISNTYYIEGVAHSGLEPLEYLFVEKILKGTALLRQDELNNLLEHLRAVTDDAKKLTAYGEPYLPPDHNKALLKTHGDLISTIATKKCINITYFKENEIETDEGIIPCAIQYDSGYMFLAAYKSNTVNDSPCYYRIDNIFSFEIIRTQTAVESEKVKQYSDKRLSKHLQAQAENTIDIRLKCDRDCFYHISETFKCSEILNQNTFTFEVKITANEDTFLSWIFVQERDKILILEPQEIKQKLSLKAEEILQQYGGKQ